jgi:hypothetical protein
MLPLGQTAVLARSASAGHFDAAGTGEAANMGTRAIAMTRSIARKVIPPHGPPASSYATLHPGYKPDRPITPA